MARRGRPRLVCPREPNGRPSRSAAKALERQVQAETRPEGLISPLEIRRFWTKAAGTARLEAFGTPVGQLILFGKLDEAQYSAARAWARLAARYRLAIEAPRTPRSAGLERIGSRSVGAGVAPGDAIDKAVIDRFWRRAACSWPKAGRLSGRSANVAKSWGGRPSATRSSCGCARA
jgi:hypothetical protein